MTARSRNFVISGVVSLTCLLIVGIATEVGHEHIWLMQQVRTNAEQIDALTKGDDQKDKVNAEILREIKAIRIGLAKSGVLVQVEP